MFLFIMLCVQTYSPVPVRFLCTMQRKVRAPCEPRAFDNNFYFPSAPPSLSRRDGRRRPRPKTWTMPAGADAWDMLPAARCWRAGCRCPLQRTTKSLGRPQARWASGPAGEMGEEIPHGHAQRNKAATTTMMSASIPLFFRPRRPPQEVFSGAPQGRPSQNRCWPLNTRMAGISAPCRAGGWCPARPARSACPRPASGQSGAHTPAPP